MLLIYGLERDGPIRIVASLMRIEEDKTPKLGRITAKSPVRAHVSHERVQAGGLQPVPTMHTRYLS